MKIITTKHKGVSYNKLKNGDKTFYITYKDKENISRRRKVGKQSKGMTAAQAFAILQDLNKTKKHQEVIHLADDSSLMSIAILYFQQQITDRFGAVEAKFLQAGNREAPERIKLDSFNYGVNAKRIDFYIEYLKELQAYYPPLAQKILNYRKVILKFKANVAFYGPYNTKPLSETNKQEINFLTTRLLAMGKSKKTIADVISLLRSIVNWSIENDFYFGDNPFQGFKYTSKKKQRDRYLDKEEIGILLNRMKKENTNLYLCTYLGLVTAGRANTVLNIQKKDIDFKNNMITLINYKADRTYKILLTEDTIKYLKKVTYSLDRDDYLIQPTRQKEYKKKPLYKIPPKYYAICDELFNSNIDKKIEPEKIVNYHTLRHTVASLMAIDGESIYKIKYLLDHKSIEETQRYAKLRTESLENMVENYYTKNIFQQPDITAEKELK